MRVIQLYTVSMAKRGWVCALCGRKITGVLTLHSPWDVQACGYYRDFVERMYRKGNVLLKSSRVSERYHVCEFCHLREV